jgi:transcriptional regulator with XRE-family HTH domain
MAVASPKASIGDRLKAVREATALLQKDFVARLNDVVAELYGDRAVKFDAPRVSKLENGRQEPTFADIAVYAMVDPLRRGKLWLAWEEEVDSAMAAPRRHGPSVIKQPPDEIFNQPVPRRRKPGERQA